MRFFNKYGCLTIFALIFIASSFSAYAEELTIKTPVLSPQSWCQPPNNGGGDIYSSFVIKQGNKYLMYFGGFYESCRIHDAIYVADYEPISGIATHIRQVLLPEKIG